MQKQKIQVSPSILAADFSNLEREIKRAEEAGADALHLDIMDGHFVPNISFGPQIVGAIKRVTNLFLDVHLMIYQPYDYIERFVEMGADSITVHLEATEDLEETLGFIRRCNVKAGLSIRPETSASLLIKYLDKCDLILLMSVNPGFGGQEFMPEVLEKLSMLRGLIDQLQIRKGGRSFGDKDLAAQEDPFILQVDGGINAETARQCVQAGANSLVAGTYLFAAESMKDAIQSLR